MFGKESAGKKFNRCAINIGKTIKILEILEEKIYDEYSCNLHMNELFIGAYIFRLGVLDKIDENQSWYLNNLTIMIPKETGFPRFDKTKVKEITQKTLNRFLGISKFEEDNFKITKSILEKGADFYELDEMIDQNVKDEING